MTTTAMACLPATNKGKNIPANLGLAENIGDSSDLQKLRVLVTRLELIIMELKTMERTDTRAMQMGNICLQLSDCKKAITDLTIVKLAPSFYE